MLSNACEAAPHAEALVCGSVRMTWAELECRTAQLAAGLARSGIAHGDRVVLLLGNGVPFVLLVYAAARLGAVVVPVGVREQRAGVTHIVEDCDASALFYDDALRGVLPGSERCGALKLCLEVTSEAFEGLLSGERVELPTPSEADLAAILYTSGTTGRPKGAMLAHRNVVHSALNYSRTMGLGPEDRSLVAVPLSHVTGLVALLATAGCAGASLIVMDAFKAATFLNLAEVERITHTVMVPAMFNLCLLEGGMRRRDLSAWRVAGYGGAPMALGAIEQLAATLPDLRLMNLYGATETTSPAVLMPPAHAITRREAVGLPAPGAEILVMRDGREVPTGEVGELWIRGPMVVDGYWRNPAATASEFLGGNWRSGDIGSIDQDGFIYVHDRMKDMINRGGFKIYSAEVENIIASVDGVVEVAVVGRPCKVLGERVHAVVVVDDSTDPTVGEAELRTRIAGELADYKVPETWSISERPLPRNANGKVLKRELREGLASELTDPVRR